MTAAERHETRRTPDPPAIPRPPWRSPDRRQHHHPPRQPLSQELIVETALRILDAEGIDAITVRHVALQLGTGAASLYAHVSGKDELLELLLDRVVGEIQLPPSDAADWQEQLKELAREAKRVLVRHRGIARVAMAVIPTGPNALTVSERLLAILRAGGVPDQVAAYGLDLLGLYFTASALEDSIRPEELGTADWGPGERSHWANRLRDYFASLPPDRLPNIVALADPLTTGGTDENGHDVRFEFGLDIIIHGLAAHARR